MASRRSSCCTLCEGSNLPSSCSCSMCVNGRLIEYHTKQRMMRGLHDSLHSRIVARLEAQSKAEEQRTWRMRKVQNIKELRDRLSELKRKTAMERTKVAQASSDLKAQKASLNLAYLKKRRGDVTAMHTNAMKLGQINLMAATSERLKMQSKAVKQLCMLFPMRRLYVTASQHCSSYPFCTCSSCIRLWDFMFTYMAAEYLLEHKTVTKQSVPTFYS